jgi:hypothetical protein
MCWQVRLGTGIGLQVSNRFGSMGGNTDNPRVRLHPIKRARVTTGRTAPTRCQISSLFNRRSGSNSRHEFTDVGFPG